MPPLARLRSRRRFLAGIGASAAWLALPSRPEAQVAGDGLRVLRAQAGSGKPEREPQPAALSYEGSVPGPTLRVRRGDLLRVRLVNDLPEPTSIHWHGIRVPNAMDGVPGLTQAPVAPGASFDYAFRPPDAGTFWYHAHTGAQADRGLYGALIVDEPDRVDVDRDVLMVFGAPHRPAEPAPLVLVNGAVRPDFPVKPGERLRVRLVNATSARGFSLRVEDHAPWVIAIDGQPAEPFVARDGRIALGPGNRVDLFVAATHDEGKVCAIRAALRDEQPIARLVYGSAGNARAAVRSEPPPLPANPLPGRIDLRNSLKAELALGGAKPFDAAGPPLFSVRRGRAVTLAIRNPTGQPHAIHVHGHHVRLLDRLDDGWKPYWLDTLVVGEQVERVAFVADNAGKWLIDCHPLEQPDRAVATWFAVT